MDQTTRRQLLQELRARFPWAADPDVGPAAVEAGDCDGCGLEARLVQTCGPSSAVFLGRRCALDTGAEAWCAGHEPEAFAALDVLRGLPPDVDAVARLWWVATGELRLDPALARALMARLAVAAGAVR